MRNTIASALALVAIACSHEPTPTSSPTPTPSPTPSPGSLSASRPEPGVPPTPTSSSDTFTTRSGPLVITPLHHASLLFTFAGKTIAVDPTIDALKPETPKADYVFITDVHPDHLDPKALDAIAKPGATLVGPAAVDAQRKLTVVVANGDVHDFGAFKVEGVPMYNVRRGPEAGKLFHDKGRGDGFVFTFGDERVYVSGDTECTPEMRALANIDVALVCMNLPYTMPPDEAAECVKAFKPKIVYPYHYRGQDPAAAFAPDVRKAGIDVRLRDWYAK